MDMIKDTTTNKDKEIARRGENDDQIDDYDPFDEERVNFCSFLASPGLSVSFKVSPY